MLGIAVGVAIAVVGCLMTTTAHGDASPLKFPLYINGDLVKLENGLVQDGRTYIQLREFCGKTNVGVEWVDPSHEVMPIPGGSYYQGINLTVPTYVYTREVSDWTDSNLKKKCVEITGLVDRYSSEGMKYHFDSNGNFVVKDGAASQTYELHCIPLNGRHYVTVEEFKEKIQPYLTDMCMQ